jgi:hypothetical protein
MPLKLPGRVACLLLLRMFRVSCKAKFPTGAWTSLTSSSTAPHRVRNRQRRRKNSARSAQRVFPVAHWPRPQHAGHTTCKFPRHACHRVQTRRLVLRLMCLHSVISGGLKPKVLESYKCVRRARLPPASGSAHFVPVPVPVRLCGGALDAISFKSLGLSMC